VPIAAATRYWTAAAASRWLRPPGKIAFRLTVKPMIKDRHQTGTMNS
jgi:hypothetical protein